MWLLSVLWIRQLEYDADIESDELGQTTFFVLEEMLERKTIIDTYRHEFQPEIEARGELRPVILDVLLTVSQRVVSNLQ